jgi:hypothetical protein
MSQQAKKLTGTRAFVPFRDDSNLFRHDSNLFRDESNFAENTQAGLLPFESEGLEEARAPRTWVRVTLCVLAPTEDLRNLINKAAILSKTRAVTRGLTPVPLLYEGLDPGAFTNKHSVQVA